MRTDIVIKSAHLLIGSVVDFFGSVILFCFVSTRFFLHWGSVLYFTMAACRTRVVEAYDKVMALPFIFTAGSISCGHKVSLVQTAANLVDKELDLLESTPNCNYI